MDLAARIRRTAEREGLWQPGDTILAAVSGGPDSTAMLHLLRRLSGECGFRLAAAHVNHGFRGEESAREAEFVRRLCEELGVPLDAVEYDLPSYIEETGMNAQAAAREKRYAFLRSAAARRGASRIALAHHADDQAETVLMRLLRGAGTSGIAGMPMKRREGNVELIRPLLRISKLELLQYCAREGLGYCEDSSNRKTVYFRNAVRLEILPFLERYNPNVSASLVRLAEISRAEDDFLTREAERAMAGLVRREQGGFAMERGAFLGLHVALQRRLITLILIYLGVEKGAIPFERIDAIREAAAEGSPTTSVIEAGRGVRFLREYDVLRWMTGDAAGDDAGFEYEVTADVRELAIPEAGGRLVFRRMLRAAGEPLPSPGAESRCAALFDEDAVAYPLRVRSRRPGDRMRLAGLNGSKKVQDIFVDGKVARAMRSRIPLVADAEGRLLWIAGIRRSADAPVTEDTTRILRIEWQDDTLEVWRC
ncbi:MAG: tRNA lysidine(34) synthetase TilS [Paenibacillaceae bacterium]|jgi:tRNA(Ile)-lysidine synthase|nr:MAG: tRNA lysidine(34) synthetase TilS [Paenibacillaceae bacterium]